MAATIFNLGSINADHVYRVPHLPAAGETVAASGYRRGLGGKGANQSVAVARAGADVVHVGAVGSGDDWLRDALAAHGVGVAAVPRLDMAGGHAVVQVDAAGENAIVIHPGANRALDANHLRDALQGARPGDWLLLQNETNLQAEAASQARGRGMQVACCAAPFDAGAVRAVLPFADLLLLNSVEADQLRNALGQGGAGVEMVTTRGARGAVWTDAAGRVLHDQPGFSVSVRDTTGAGDCFAGYLVAGLAQGLARAAALRRAVAASALQVTREGAADAIPRAGEVAALLAQDP